MNASILIIIFGGGWGAEGTQASIEAQVGALEVALRARSPKLLFASSDPAVRDVQIPGAKRDEAGELLALIFDRLDNFDVAYRPSVLGKHASASKRGLLDAIGASKEATIVLGVGHGNPATETDRATIELWGADDRLAVDELAKYLDGGQRKGPIAFVLGQCHSGAFTDLMFEAANDKEPIAEPARCVVAAVPADREAAGCTPDIGDPDARAYMAMIAEALEKNASADLDKDGRVSIAEAHAFARIRDRTVDVPVSTSEAFVRRALGTRAPRAESIGAIAKLLPRARPAERAVIEALAADVSPKVASDQLKAMEEKLEKLAVELADLDRDRDRVRRKILDAVLTRWPELANPYHAESRRLLAGDAEEVVALISSQRELGELRERDLSIHEKEREQLELEKKAARVERWLRAIEQVAGEDALRKAKNRKALADLDRLIACESLPLN